MVLWILRLIGITQALLALPVTVRMLRGVQQDMVQPAGHGDDNSGRISVLIPVLNERSRLGPCLEGTIAQGDEVREIIVADGGSDDGTQALVLTYAKRDSRIQLIETGCAPPGVNGKAHNLARAMAESDPASDWVLTLDADTRPAPALTASLVAQANRLDLRILSAATQQRVSGPADAMVHPAMLTTLIYRFGIPGRATTRVTEVQANGQCFLIRRELLAKLGGFESVTDSICEDITLARAAAAAGERVGFYETGSLIEVEMYPSWFETWRNWSRSLPMHDRYAGRATIVGLATVTLVQALPLWITLVTSRHRDAHALTRRLNLGLLLMRLGTLAGSSRAYANRPWTYWLSPLVDLPVALKLWASYARRRHTWRGRDIVRGGRS